MGRAIALRLAEDVSGVAVHYFSRRDEAQELAAAIRDKGKLSAVFRADLTKKAQAAGLIKKVEEKFARIDILVNNVGPFLVKPWDQLEVADWERVLRGNLLGLLLLHEGGPARHAQAGVGEDHQYRLQPGRAPRGLPDDRPLRRGQDGPAHADPDGGRRRSRERHHGQHGLARAHQGRRHAPGP